MLEKGGTKKRLAAIFDNRFAQRLKENSCRIDPGHEGKQEPKYCELLGQVWSGSPVREIGP